MNVWQMEEKTKGSTKHGPPELPPNQILYRAEQVAKILGVGRSTVFAWIKNGDIAVVRFGRSVRIHRNDLENFVENHRVYD